MLHRAHVKAARAVNTPPGAIAAALKRKRLQKAEHEAAKTALPLGLCFITEGVLPFLVLSAAHCSGHRGRTR